LIDGIYKVYDSYYWWWFITKTDEGQTIISIMPELGPIIITETLRY
jgi:hypothetical protein